MEKLVLHLSAASTQDKQMFQTVKQISQLLFQDIFSKNVSRTSSISDVRTPFRLAVVDDGFYGIVPGAVHARA